MSMQPEQAKLILTETFNLATEREDKNNNNNNNKLKLKRKRNVLSERHKQVTLKHTEQ